MCARACVAAATLGGAPFVALLLRILLLLLGVLMLLLTLLLLPLPSLLQLLLLLPPPGLLQRGHFAQEQTGGR